MLSEAVINNENLGYRNLKRIYNYVNKRPEFENKLFSEGCDAVMYHSFGGQEMKNFLENELKRLNAWLN